MNSLKILNRLKSLNSNLLKNNTIYSNIKNNTILFGINNNQYKGNNNHSNNNNDNQNQNNRFFRKTTLLSSIGLIGVLSTAHLINHLDQNNSNNVNSKLPKDVIIKLMQIFGNRFTLNDQDRDAHGKDFSYHDRCNPDAIVYPINEDEVRKLILICSEYRVPIIPYGSGTSLEGHTIAIHGGVTIDFHKMQKVLEICLDDQYVTVQPGISYDDLNIVLKDKGYFFGCDPGPGASIGGMVGTSCSGTHAVRYGTMKDNVISLRAILPNGDVIKTRSKAKKSSAGYDLTHLFIGSEGTLGITTEVTLKIQPLPEHSSVSLVTFDSIDDASKTVIQTMQSGIQIGRVELLDDVMMKAVNQANGTSYQEKSTLIFEFTGSKSTVSEQIQRVREISNRNHSSEFKFSSTPEEKDALWLARKTALWSSKVLKPDSEVWITDACVPVSKLATIIGETKSDIEKTSLLAPLVSHAGDGNFHLFILFNPNDTKEVLEAQLINHNLVERAIQYNGTCTGEHGVSFGKIKYLDQELGKETVNLMKTIKKAIDPNNIMNPGKIITVEDFNKF
ncbi:Glycolate oxidase subunit D-like protein [Tieghemostelium lacteum]|uniref:D-lactate dehydrogenase (cytochrome) n=1 Tax=Tieghemostelium lacteum TaxID=361077 RepID=A0A151ZSE6_TIELA|nr:Glycolate oxidase subunit D-like protein [Tieghemostelium lacteum]|eukprot:KYQ96704.1 Glycolate oxidase subunit D-like protein [Tieghemostelium lacteum]